MTKYLFLSSLVTLTGCAYGQINEIYDLRVSTAQIELEISIMKLNYGADYFQIDESTPTALCDQKLRRAVKACWNSRNGRDTDIICKAADIAILEKLDNLKFAEYAESYKLCNSEEKRKQILARISHEINCKPKLESEMDATLYCVEQVMRENHNLGVQARRDLLVSEAKALTASKINDLNYNRSVELSNESARVSAALNQLSNNLNNMATQQKLQNIQANQNQIMNQQQQIMFNQQNQNTRGYRINNSTHGY